jgi:hypothetical protein
MGVTEAPTPTTAESIVDLTNETFDRVQAHLDRYARDSRRISETGSLVLSSNVSIMYEPDHHHGFLALKVCNTEAAERMIHAVRDSSLFFRFFSLDKVTGPGQEDITRRDDWDFQGYMPIVKVMRERYPEGNLDYRLWKGPESGDWGERHKVGVNLMALCTHKGLPLEERHTYKISLSHRFDKAEPQLSAQHDVFISFGNEDDEPGRRHRYSLSGPEHTEKPDDMDVRTIRGFLETARDLRPVAGGPDEIARFDKFITGIAAETGFSLPSSSEPTA